MMEIKAKKIDANTTLYQDSLTNDPIAVSSAIPDRHSSKKEYAISWHPDARAMHPPIADLVNTNLKRGNSAENAKTIVEFAYNNILTNRKRDPLKVVHAGTSTKRMGEKEVSFDDFHLHTDDGKHVATLHVNKTLTPHIGVNDDKFVNSYAAPGELAHLTFHDDTPALSKFAISQKKHPGLNNPIAMMHQVKHWLDTKDVQPSFVGYAKHPGFKSYKTALSPEEASSKYFDHLHNQASLIKHKFNRVTPTMFTATKYPESEYASGSHEMIDTSEPGIVKHYSVKTHHIKSHETSSLQEVIE